MKSENEETSHVPLPQGLYKYGEAYASGVCPVIGAHAQVLWYSVPGMYTQFTDLEEAEMVVLVRAQLRAVEKVRSELQRLSKFIENFLNLTESGYEGDALIWALRTEAALNIGKL